MIITAQLYITASMWQMLRGSVIIITGKYMDYLLLSEAYPLFFNLFSHQQF